MNKIFEKIWEKLKETSKLKDSPYAVGMGAAVGVFWNFIPSVGIGPFLSMGLAKLLKASGVAALTINLATGIFIPFFYSLNLMTGRMILNRDVKPEEVGGNIQKSFQDNLEVVDQVKGEPSRFFSLDSITSVSLDFIIGSAVNALLAAGIVYTIFWLLIRYRPHLPTKAKVDSTKDPDKIDNKNSAV